MYTSFFGPTKNETSLHRLADSISIIAIIMIDITTYHPRNNHRQAFTKPLKLFLQANELACSALSPQPLSLHLIAALG
jgi:hypothetical protein